MQYFVMPSWSIIIIIIIIRVQMYGSFVGEPIAHATSASNIVWTGGQIKYFWIRELERDVSRFAVKQRGKQYT